MAPLFGGKRNRYSTLSLRNAQPAPTPAKKKDIPEGVFEKCQQCEKTIYKKQREENLFCCPSCGFHYPMTAQRRIDSLTDKDSFKEIDAGLESVDFLKFPSYVESIESKKKNTGMNSAIVTGVSTLDKRKLAIGVMDFRFIGGSLGSVVGEKVTRLTELATKERLPLVIVTASGGARMQEGMMSLMQMAKTSGALYRHDQAELPYIVIMTHPTTAGVTASYASLGDLVIAEPGALIGFAGPRVIKDTTQAKLPEGFQTSEFLWKKGMIDRIVDRKNLRTELSLCLEYFSSPCKNK